MQFRWPHLPGEREASLRDARFTPPHLRCARPIGALLVPLLVACSAASPREADPTPRPLAPSASASASASATSPRARGATGFEKHLAHTPFRTCALDAEGAAYCWGDTETPAGSSVVRAPARVDGVPPLVDLALDHSTACGVSREGELWCWGRAPYAPRYAVLDKPRKVAGLREAVTVAMADDHTCVLLSDGRVACMGERDALPKRDDDATRDRLAVVPGFDDVVQVVAAKRLTCALDAAGHVRCAGRSECRTYRSTSAPERPFDERVFRRIQASDGALCAVAADGRTSCLPCGSERVPDLPELPPELVADTLALDGPSACALRQGALRCATHFSSNWYRARELRVGGSPALREIPLRDVREVALSWSSACALLGDGRVACWGENLRGSLGMGGDLRRMTPPVTPQGEGLRAVASDAVAACGLVEGGRVRCWGAAPVDDRGLVPGVAEASALFDGAQEICALAGDTLHCIGEASVTAIPLPKKLVHAASSSWVRCLVFDDGSVSCTGRDGRDGLPEWARAANRQKGVAALALADDHLCLLDRAGGVRCAGSNEGLALGRPGEPAGFVAVPGVGRAVEIGGRGATTCAREGSSPRGGAEARPGRVVCWGGDDARLRALPGRGKPAAVVGAASALAVGEGHACALTPDRGLVCWGSDLWGQLGNDDADSYALAPAPVALAGVTAISAGPSHTCALVGGALRCWGKNTAGQLGDDIPRGRYAAPAFVPGLPAPR